MLKALAEDSEAEFKKAFEGKNNEAFVKFSERDIPMNYMREMLAVMKMWVFD